MLFLSFYFKEHFYTICPYEALPRHDIIDKTDKPLTQYRTQTMNRFSTADQCFMNNALEQAAEVKGATMPNPAVGAVIVRDGTVIGEGATSPWGGPHAEKVALKKAGADAKGATLYVTLEPCCHFGKTPPCTDAIISAGIIKVIIAHRDPNPLVAGKGIRQLRNAGIEVAIGLLGKAAKQLNEDFCHSITTRKAFITLKLALTLDGYIADINGNSKWITSPGLRHIVHDLRRKHGAIAVGSGTLLADDPRLTVRTGKKASPVRIIFSSKKEIPTDSFFYQNAKKTRSIIVVRKRGSRRIVQDAASGIEYWFTGTADPVESMRRFTETAFSENINSIFVEGGGTVAATLLNAKVVNRLYLFYGNQILGAGMPGIPLQSGLAITEGITLKERKSFCVGDDIYLTGIPLYPTNR